MGRGPLVISAWPVGWQLPWGTKEEERRGEEKGREQRKAVAFLAQAEGPWFGGQNVEAAEKFGGGGIFGGGKFSEGYGMMFCM